MHTTTWVRVRAVALAMALVGISAGLRHLLAPPLAGLLASLRAGGAPALAGWPFDRLLTGGCAVVLAACWCWLLLVALPLLLEVIRTGGSPRQPRFPRLARLAPSVVRRVLLAGCGAALGATVVVPAYAEPGGSPARPDGTVAVLDGLQVPDRFPGRPATQTRVVVRPGDSLWLIAERLLPRDSDDQQVTFAWHRIHQANRHRIGADPDLVLPGTVLRIPP